MTAPQQSGRTGRPGQADQPGQPAEPGRPPDVYRSVVALVVWWVWAAFAAANLIDLAIQAHTHFAAEVCAALLLITGVTYVSAFRPQVVAGDDGLEIKNPLRDHRVPWGCVDRLELGDSLEIHCQWEDGAPRRKKLYAWAVHSPRRSRIKAEMRARRKLSSEQSEPTSFGKLPPEAKAALGKTDAEHIVDSLRSRGARSAKDGRGHDGTARPASRWDPLSVAVLVIPAVLLVIVVLA